MEVNDVLNSSPTSTANQTSAGQSTQNTQAENPAAATKLEDPVDKVEISNESKKVYTPDSKEVRRLIDEANNRTESFRRLVESLLNKQAAKNAIASGLSKEDEYDNILNKIFGGEDVMVEVDEATRLKAQEDISEDGYYGVKQTSERLLDFAKAISGGDPSKIELLREAVEKGFKEAEALWGGKLPQISQDTYEATMKGFDEWEKSAKAANA